MTQEEISKRLLEIDASNFGPANGYVANDDICIVDEIRVDNTAVLTAEILEKIGFVEFMPHNWQIVIDNIMIEIREPEHNMAIWLDWNEHDTGTYASYIFPVPNYVHELQHALRLCNIEKEIEL